MHMAALKNDILVEIWATSIVKGQELVNERCLQVYEIQDVNTFNDASQQ